MLWGVVVVCLSLLVGAAYLPLDVLTVRPADDRERCLAAARIEPGWAISVFFAHPEKGHQVEKRFRARPGAVWTRLQTRNLLGRSDPAQTDPGWVRWEGDWLVIREDRKQVPALEVDHSPSKQVKIDAGGQELELSERLKEGRVIIGIERSRLWRWTWWLFTGRTFP